MPIHCSPDSVIGQGISVSDWIVLGLVVVVALAAGFMFWSLVLRGKIFHK